MLIASIYGMNVDGLPMAQGLYSFVIVGAIIVMVFFAPIFYFRRRGWL